MAKKYKKNKVKKLSVEAKKEVKKEIKVPSYFNYIFGVLLLAIFALSLYLRAVMPYDSVFRDGVVAFASDDAVYHMRLVENTLYNFPHRIIYDPFTMYPYGSLLHWGPLWTQLIATFSLIIGLGGYTMQTANIVGAFMPAVFGALVVFPVYVIGKNLGNRRTGLLAAFIIAVLPGQFFSRSTLGFTDHHVAEVFFSTATLAFFILALKAGRERNIRLSEVHLKEKALIYSLFAGVMLSAFQLSWPGAPFFAMIMLIFIVIQYILDDVRGKSTDYLAVASIPMFLISLILLLPYFSTENGFGLDKYSWFHTAVALGGMVLPAAFSVISREIKKRGYDPYYYPFALGGFFMAGMLGIKIILPQIYSTIVNAPGNIFSVRIGGPATVAETTSILEKPGYLFANFPVTGFLQKDNFVILFLVLVLLAISFRIVKKQRPEDMLFLVWSIIMILAIFGQNRWAYYLAVNVALMVGYVGAALSEKVLKFGGWDWPVDNNYLKNITLNQSLSIILVVIILLFFAYPSFAETYSTYSRSGGGEPSGGAFSEWLETLTWMRYSTPDPGMDYLAIYEKPKNSTYPYPETAYGVMSWWDYGHVITYWGHRIPNANPFQAGIGGGAQHAPGASTFLTAKSEEEANDVLDALGINGKPGARYIVSNGYMAFQIMQVFEKWIEDEYLFTEVQTSSGPRTLPARKYYDNMEAKLHIFDGNGLKRYRLVHESAPNPYTLGGYLETQYKSIYNVLYGGNIPVENTGAVKVFEYVKGAKITGKAPPNATVTLTNTIQTNIGRTVSYSQAASSNGTYTFTVPYSTLGPIPGGTQFDTKPTGPYTITAGAISKQIDVGEKEVLEGRTVTLDMV